MQELMLLSGNPKRRRRHAKKAKRRSSRRRHARRAMSPLQLQYFGGGRRSRRRAAVRANPKRARRRSRSRSRGFAVVGGLGRIFRTNPGSVSHPFSIVGPALTGAVGAVAVNTVVGKFGNLLPPSVMTGNISFVTRGALAIGLGMLASRIGVGSAVASKMAEGSLTVTLHEALVSMGAQAGLNLSGMGYYLPGRQGPMPAASGNPARLAGMGKYVTGPGSPSGSVVPMNRQARGFGNIATSFKF